MQFTEDDREVLYQVWMTHKAKRHLTQMDMAKRLGISVVEFSDLLRKREPLTLSFIAKFCQILDLQPHNIVPSLKHQSGHAPQLVYLQNRVIIDGDIQRVQVEGNQVIIDYCSPVKAVG
ncbi:helix-turn-helix domain-containing protein [Vibrio algicola]|uniref:Helix-turn-helix domain-containing protein n=1 Tax=Vibrio algicola TaxID=2662262 RepID=A0A5Q0TGU1_9VIBR|nr:helix-turn-helix transcriptional regulator [Vibrio algicola]